MTNPAKEKRLFTVGFQPLEIVPKDYKIVDLMNLVTDEGVKSNNLRAEVIEKMKTWLPAEMVAGQDFLLLNTVRNRDIIPYSVGVTLLYDPPYVSSASEIKKLLGNIAAMLGDEKARTFNHIDTINSVRATLALMKDNIPQSDYFNFLTLLTDINSSDPEALVNQILTYRTPYDMPAKKKAIFLGDPVHPDYFRALNAQNIFVVSFMPYDFFTLTCDKLDDYYFENPLFQSHLYLLVELRRIIQQYQVDVIILNPGGIYLTDAEADFYAYSLAQDATIFKLNGSYSGQPIQI